MASEQRELDLCTLSVPHSLPFLLSSLLSPFLPPTSFSCLRRPTESTLDCTVIE